MSNGRVCFREETSGSRSKADLKIAVTSGSRLIQDCVHVYFVQISEGAYPFCRAEVRPRRY